MAKVLKVRASKEVRKNAILKYKALCHYYNTYSKMIDIVKEMLERGMWDENTTQEHPDTIDSLNHLAECALHVQMDFTDTRDFIRTHLSEIERLQESGQVFIHPVDYMRINGMREVEFYLTELEKEAFEILHEVTDILNKINPKNFKGE